MFFLSERKEKKNMKDDVLMMEMGERIRKRRNELNISQRVLASAAGLSQSFLSEVESGKHTLSALALRNIAIVLRISADWLLDIEPDTKTDR